MHIFCIKFVKLLLLHESQVKKYCSRVFPMKKIPGSF
jgi:hypothetical protein